MNILSYISLKFKRNINVIKKVVKQEYTGTQKLTF